ncbi:uncharacterized protein LOC113147025 [Cyclospora cayetanensis]|uniref:Uncharacterized protein LOC113147025 n=1 Tax=Cyclospora cayetanensis TaxID=88456 RepID=A0A6P6RVJ9_9EIME|nr:uncharacterized protein LOC113147025 [Cyclospora cayetanensis]
MNSTFHYHPSGRQELAVTTGSHSPIHKVVGVHALQIHAEEDSRSTVDSASSKISYSQDHSTTGSTHVKTRWKFSDTSFLQEIPVPSTAILVVVGTCIILVLTVVGIVTYYALFNRTKVRRQSARERLKCYDGEQKAIVAQQGHDCCLPNPRAPRESFNSLYNLPSGFNERKTPSDIEYERQALSTRFAQYSETARSPRGPGLKPHPKYSYPPEV